MTITHHLDDATLMSFAAGSLPGCAVRRGGGPRRHVHPLPPRGRGTRACRRRPARRAAPATLDRAEPPASAIWGQTPRPDVHENRQRAARGLTPFLRSPVLCAGPCRRRWLACSRRARRRPVAAARARRVASPLGGHRQRRARPAEGRPRPRRAGARPCRRRAHARPARVLPRRHGKLPRRRRRRPRRDDRAQARRRSRTRLHLPGRQRAAGPFPRPRRPPAAAFARAVVLRQAADRMQCWPRPLCPGI